MKQNLVKTLATGMALSAALYGAEKAKKSATKAESAHAKVARALSAAPPQVAKDATVAEMDEHGKLTVLRRGTSEFTCFPGHKGVVGDDAVCLDAASMQWTTDWMGHKPKPTNAKPGVAYMLAGATDWSADDPYANSGKPIKEPPHWMIMTPFDPKTTGLSSKASQTGTWIMWAGTPYAHLMINQRP